MPSATFDIPVLERTAVFLRQYDSGVHLSHQMLPRGGIIHHLGPEHI